MDQQSSARVAGKSMMVIRVTEPGSFLIRSPQEAQAAELLVRARDVLASLAVARKHVKPPQSGSRRQLVDNTAAPHAPAPGDAHGVADGRAADVRPVAVHVVDERVRYAGPRHLTA
jgi:hypothetical protein